MNRFIFLANIQRCRVSFKHGSYFEPEVLIALGLQFYSSVIVLALFPASPSHHPFGLFWDDIGFT